MAFDDYSYELYNKYILIDPERDETDQNKVDLGNFVPQQVKKLHNGRVVENDITENVKLTENLVDQQSENTQHKFSELDVETEIEREEKIRLQKIEQDREKQEQMERDTQARLQEAQNLTTNKQSVEESEAMSQYEEDEVEYEIYYDSRDIQELLQVQKQNLFTDINESKK